MLSQHSPKLTEKNCKFRVTTHSPRFEKCHLSYTSVCVNSIRWHDVNWLITLAGQNWPWVFGTLIYEGVNLERGEDWFEPFLNIHTPLSPTVTPVFWRGTSFYLTNPIIPSTRTLHVSAGRIAFTAPPTYCESRFTRCNI